MRYLTISILVFCFACSPKIIDLKIKVKSQVPISAQEAICIAGNHLSLGNWNPGAITLSQINSDENLWEIELQFPKGTELAFKFTKGSWDTEAINIDGKVQNNYLLTVEKDTSLYFEIPFWKDSLSKLPPEITGNYVFHEDFPVQNLPNRDVIVWLPPSYEKENAKNYPVLYIQDGQNVFDPNTSYHGVDWRIDEIADSLIKAEKIEEFIGVAIYCNSGNRTEEYSDHEPYGDYYQEFMCCQLKPFIDSTYRTKQDAKNTAVIGASMGGLIAFIMAWEYPDVFGNAGCMSSAFKFSYTEEPDFDYVEDVVNYTGEKQDINLYMDNGTEDLESLLQPGNDEMMKALNEKGYPFEWYLDKGATHNEMAWSKRVWRPLVQFFGKENQ